MKVIKYQMQQTVVIDGVEQPLSEEYMSSVIIPYSTENEERAKAESYKGEYTIFDNGMPDPVNIPSQLDIIEAQVTYTAMMTDTLLEV